MANEDVDDDLVAEILSDIPTSGVVGSGSGRKATTVIPTLTATTSMDGMPAKAFVVSMNDDGITKSARLAAQLGMAEIQSPANHLSDNNIDSGSSDDDDMQGRNGPIAVVGNDIASFAARRNSNPMSRHQGHPLNEDHKWSASDQPLSSISSVSTMPRAHHSWSKGEVHDVPAAISTTTTDLHDLPAPSSLTPVLHTNNSSANNDHHKWTPPVVAKKKFHSGSPRMISRDDSSPATTIRPRTPPVDHPLQPVRFHDDSSHDLPAPSALTSVTTTSVLSPPTVPPRPNYTNRQHTPPTSRLGGSHHSERVDIGSLTLGGGHIVDIKSAPLSSATTTTPPRRLSLHGGEGEADDQLMRLESLPIIDDETKFITPPTIGTAAAATSSTTGSRSPALGSVAKLVATTSGSMSVMPALGASTVPLLIQQNGRSQTDSPTSLTVHHQSVGKGDRSSARVSPTPPLSGKPNTFLVAISPMDQQQNGGKLSPSSSNVTAGTGNGDSTNEGERLDEKRGRSLGVPPASPMVSSSIASPSSVNAVLFTPKTTTATTVATTSLLTVPTSSTTPKTTSISSPNIESTPTTTTKAESKTQKRDWGTSLFASTIAITPAPHVPIVHGPRNRLCGISDSIRYKLLVGVAFVVLAAPLIIIIRAAAIDTPCARVFMWLPFLCLYFLTVSLSPPFIIHGSALDGFERQENQGLWALGFGHSLLSLACSITLLVLAFNSHNGDICHDANSNDHVWIVNVFYATLPLLVAGSVLIVACVVSIDPARYAPRLPFSATCLE
jgi:hypothetical protein